MYSKRNHFFILCLLFLGINITGAKPGKYSSPATVADISLQDVIQKYPDKITNLFGTLNLNNPGLEKVKTAADKKDWETACLELIKYYRQGNTAAWFRKPIIPASTQNTKTADEILEDTFTFQEVRFKQPRINNEKLDWLHLGLNKDVEWGYALNRVTIFTSLLAAYQNTKQPKYARHFNNLVIDWVTNNPLPEKESNTVTWRQLEVGLRLGYSWPGTFYGFLKAPEFTDAAIILMLSSLPEQAEYVKKYHRTHHNWAAMQFNGLATAGLSFPEFKNATAWYEYALAGQTEEVAYEVYPDGAQKELTSHYHIVALANFEKFADISAQAGKKVPASFREVIANMYNYLAYTNNPQGEGLLNNDSDLNDNRNRITKAAQEFNRPDWRYIASFGKEGIKPGKTSVVFPWAGQVIMRSGYDNKAHFSFFDAGPWGISHQHNDQLHLSVSAYGRELLVDGGRYWYRRDNWRNYFLGSESHNVVLIDNLGQNKTPTLYDKPMTGNYSLQPALDFSIDTYTAGFGTSGNPENKTTIPGKHTRAVVYVKDKYWVVFDKIETDAEHTISPLWHFNPTCTVTKSNNSIVTTDAGQGNIRIVPISTFNWQVNLVKGQEKPAIQGWYSETYNKKEPNVCAVYSAKVPKTSTFAWVLLPANGAVPEIKTRLLKSDANAMLVEITVPGQAPTQVALNFDKAGKLELGKGLELIGNCAIIQKDQKPLVALGQIREKGKLVVEDKFTGK